MILAALVVTAAQSPQDRAIAAILIPAAILLNFVFVPDAFRFANESITIGPETFTYTSPLKKKIEGRLSDIRRTSDRLALCTTNRKYIVESEKGDFSFTHALPEATELYDRLSKIAPIATPSESF